MISLIFAGGKQVPNLIMKFTIILLCLLGYYPICRAQTEESGCPSLVTIPELTNILGWVPDLRPTNGIPVNIAIQDFYINCLSIQGYYHQATYTVRFTGEPGNNGSTLAQVDLVCVFDWYWHLGSLNSYNKITNISDAILLATNDTILTNCSRCNAPNHPILPITSSNGDQLRHCRRKSYVKLTDYCMYVSRSLIFTIIMCKCRDVMSNLNKLIVYLLSGGFTLELVDHTL